MQLNSQGRDLLAVEALSYISRIIQMCDRNPLSRTYGCFDRSFWHYKTTDFPSGMYQENVLSLALVYTYPFPGNRWFQEERIREWALAGMRFAKESSHRDGSCDDYYPFERAFGAAAFSLYAMTEGFLILKCDDEGGLIEFFRKRGQFLDFTTESGRLSNHHALAALALYNLYLITKDHHFKEASQRRVLELLSWQDSEGWFYEYEGCDPGYLTATISFLSKYFQKSQDQTVVEPLRRAISFAAHFIHPDGSYGGEYGSRSTFHFYPHGFEVMSSLAPEGKRINDLFLQGIPRGKRHRNDDDRLFGHIVYDYLQTWLDFAPVRSNSSSPECLSQECGSKYFPNSGMLIHQNKNYSSVVNLFKGGVIKAFSPDRAFLSDTGITVRDERGRRAATALYQKHESQPNAPIADGGGDFTKLTVKGDFFQICTSTSTPVKQILFRLLNLTLGRMNSQLLRRVLQQILILNKRPFDLSFEREISLHSTYIQIQDRLLPRKNLKLTQVAMGSDQLTIYTAAANSYQESVLLPWHHLSKDEVERLNQGEELVVQRRYDFETGSE